MNNEGFGGDFFGSNDPPDSEDVAHESSDDDNEFASESVHISEDVLPDSVYGDPMHPDHAYPDSEAYLNEDPMEYGIPDQDMHASQFEPGTDASMPGSDDTAAWDEQTTPFTCGVMSTRSVIHSLTGQEFSEAQLVYDATANGWLTDGGMTLDGVANLLELHGVPCEMRVDGNIDELIAELQQGHRAIVAVDSGEIWKTDSILSDFADGADHAIAVSDVRVNEEGIPVVVVNDSGVPDAAGKEYPLEDFMDAWSDSGFSYVVTQ